MPSTSQSPHLPRRLGFCPLRIARCVHGHRLKIRERIERGAIERCGFRDEPGRPDCGAIMYLLRVGEDGHWLFVAEITEAECDALTSAPLREIEVLALLRLTLPGVREDLEIQGSFDEGGFFDPERQT
jgi:hypothetical protein